MLFHPIALLRLRPKARSCNRVCGNSPAYVRESSCRKEAKTDQDLSLKESPVRKRCHCHHLLYAFGASHSFKEALQQLTLFFVVNIISMPCAALLEDTCDVQTTQYEGTRSKVISRMILKELEKFFSHVDLSCWRLYISLCVT